MADQDEIKKKLIETSQIVENTLKSVAAQIGDIFQDALSEADGITKIFGKDVEKQLKSLARSTDKMVENQIKIKAGQASSKDISKQILDYQIKREVLEKRILNLTGEQNDLKEQLKRQLADVDAANQDYIEGLKEQESQLKKIEARMGVMGKLAKGLNKIPLIGNLIDAKEVEEKMKIAANKGKSPLIAGFKEAGKTMTKSIVDPLTIFTFLATQINKADKQATLLGKSFGVSKQQARAIREEFVKFSADTNDTFVNTDRLLKAQTELSEQLGIAVQFSGEELTTFAKLTEIVGLSAQEAGKLASFSAAAGVGTKDYLKQIRLSVFASNQANKVHFSDKLILQDISKLSAGILVKFRNNPAALADAVVQAKKLGLSLEQVDKIGESLLNFESSIENELKAELLTGRQINVEKARYAALTGDQLTLTKEIAEQAGSLADFENMNILAQKSLAELFGMSKDELADTLLKQEAINTYGKDAAKLNAQQLRDQKASGLSMADFLTQTSERQSAQEKFNNAVTKLQDLIGNLVAGPLGGFIDSLSNGLEYVTKIFGFFGKIGSAIKGFFGDKIGGAFGEAASLATISALIMLVSKSMMKGTIFNPMIVKDASAAGKGGLMDTLLGDKVGGQFKKGGGKYAKGARSGGLLKGLGKIGGGLSLLSAGADLTTNLTDPNRSTGNALGKTLDQNKFAALGAGIGGLLIPGLGALPGAAIGGILDAVLGDATQIVEDGIASSSKGPFTITDKFGATAITAKGDSLAVSPNVNNASLDLTPMIQAINEVKNAISSLADRPIYTTITLDGRALGTAVGKQQETGTAQNIYTGYKIA
jgi:hypothetical protein